MTEEKSWVSTYIDIKGYKITATEMGDTVALALAKLLPTLVEIEKDGARAWVDRNNLNVPKLDMDDVSEVEFGESLMDVAKELGGREIPEGHIYLGIKPSRVEDIRENDSYDVLAQTYSYDGTWVNFYNGSGDLSVAGHYYATQTGAKIFDGMFHWQPAQVDKAPIPGGDVLLYILGTKGKKTEDIYQNIKTVQPA